MMKVTFWRPFLTSWLLQTREGTMIVRAVKPIAKGEEVTVIKKNKERDCVCFL